MQMTNRDIFIEEAIRYAESHGYEVIVAEYGVEFLDEDGVNVENWDF